MTNQDGQENDIEMCSNTHVLPLVSNRTRNANDAFLIRENFADFPVLQMYLYLGKIKPRKAL
jgi:hypothetical protein